MELSLLLLLGAAALSAKYLWERKCLLRPLTDYWLFWGFSLYLFLDALGALAPADWALSYEKYRVVGLMAVLTLLGALLLDSREAIDRVFATLALAAVAAALLSVLGRMGAGPFPSEYDLRLSLRRDYNMFAVTILLGWSGGAFLLLRQGVSAKNRGILLLIAGVCLPPVLLSGSRRAVLLFLPIGLLVTGTALVRGWKAGKLLSAIGGTVLAFSLVAALTIAGSSLLQNLPEQAPGLPGGGGETGLQDRYETIAEGSFLSKRRILWRIAWEEYSGYPPFEKLTGQGLGRDVVLYRGVGGPGALRHLSPGGAAGGAERPQFPPLRPAQWRIPESRRRAGPASCAAGGRLDPPAKGPGAGPALRGNSGDGSAAKRGQRPVRLFV